MKTIILPITRYHLLICGINRIIYACEQSCKWTTSEECSQQLFYKLRNHFVTECVKSDYTNWTLSDTRPWSTCQLCAAENLNIEILSVSVQCTRNRPVLFEIIHRFFFTGTCMYSSSHDKISRINYIQSYLYMQFWGGLFF